MSATVLFVDDEEVILDCMQTLFAEKDLKIITASNPQNALDIISQEKIAVVVSDHNMPEMTGIELLARVRAISPDTTKILLTGMTDFQVAVDAINTGEVFRFILKPWKSNDLIQTVEEAILHYQ